MRQCAIMFLLVALLAASLGCGDGDGVASPGTPGKPETQDALLESLIESLDDLTSTKSFTNYFVPGKAPPVTALRRYQAYQYRPGGQPRITDGRATAQIKLLDVRTEKEVATVEWTFAREG